MSKRHRINEALHNKAGSVEKWVPRMFRRLVSYKVRLDRHSRALASTPVSIRSFLTSLLLEEHTMHIGTAPRDETRRRPAYVTIVADGDPRLTISRQIGMGPVEIRALSACCHRHQVSGQITHRLNPPKVLYIVLRLGRWTADKGQSSTKCMTLQMRHLHQRQDVAIAVSLAPG